MRFPLSLPCGRASAAAIAALPAILPPPPADAGVVGRDASMLWTGNGFVIDQRSFVIDEDTVEYLWSWDEAASAAGFTLDLNEKGIRLLFDEGTGPGSQAAFGFGTSAFMLFEMPDDVVFDLALVAANGQVTGFEQADASWTGNQLTLDLSGVQLAGTGASFSIEYYTSAVPAPGAAALLALAAGPWRPRRGRR